MAVDAPIVERIDADVLQFGVEWELAVVERLELVVVLEVRPAPHAAVDDVRQAFAVADLWKGGGRK